MSVTDEAGVPSLSRLILFAVRASSLRLERRAAEVFAGSSPRRHPNRTDLVGAARIAEVRCPLWTNATGAKDRALTAGKIHNIRLALRGLDGLEIPAGEVFSFWRQVGRPSRRRGFVDGRELREGCLIASPGGGLCQLSNALYEAALRAGFEIVERHAHTRVVPGSRAALGRDATVFWNYVDLRFRAARSFRIEARLTPDTLIVAFRADTPGLPRPVPRETSPTVIAHDCVSCGKSGCWRHNPEDGTDAAKTAAWLVDGCTPEFSALFNRLARPADMLILPTRRFGGRRYAWPEDVCRREASVTPATLRRSLALRRAGQGAALQARSLAADGRIAEAYAARLSPLDTELFVSQTMLPHLWMRGVLQGRSFSVLMERLPIDVLQARLDAAALFYPQSRTLTDFRASPGIVSAERDALDAAQAIFTPHLEIAASHPRSVLLDWQSPPAMDARRGGKTVLLAASALARKGAYVLREAVAGLDLDLVVSGAAVEGEDFWEGLPVRTLRAGERPSQLAAVVLPALVEHQPRILLSALASGLPVIATAACGLGMRPGLTLVSPMDATALRHALVTALET